MGNTTEDLVRTRRVTEVASRIGGHLGAQRVEIYRCGPDEVTLVAAWSPLDASGHHPSTLDGSPPGAVPVDGATSLPTGWFPWSLGNLRPERYVLIRNAGALPAAPGGDLTIADLGMVSVVHLPVDLPPGEGAGSVCAYWSTERSSWEPASRDRVCSWVRDAWVHQR